MKLEIYSTYETRTNILRSTDGLRAPRMGTLDPSMLTLATDTKGRAYGKIPMGTFFYRKPSDSMFAPLPWAKLTAVMAPAATALTIDADQAGFFKAAQVLQTAPHARITLAATWAAADILTITVGGYLISVTAANGVKADIVAAAAVAINADPVLREIVEAFSTGDNLDIFALHTTVRGYLSIAVGNTVAGNGTVAIAGSQTALTRKTVGTIATGGVNLTTGVLTLAAGYATGLPLGATLYGAFTGKIEGFLPTDLYIPDGDYDLGLLVSASPYTELMPIWNRELADRFQMIISPMA